MGLGIEVGTLSYANGAQGGSTTTSYACGDIGVERFVRGFGASYALAYGCVFVIGQVSRYVILFVAGSWDLIVDVVVGAQGRAGLNSMILDDLGL